MPKRANAENVNGSNEPDWAEALDIMEEIKASEQENSTISGSIGKKWQRIEKLGVNRVGAQLAHRIMKMETPIMVDVLRTMYALFKMKGVEVPADLVDRAEGVKIPLPGEPEGGGGGGRRPTFLPDAVDQAPAPDHPEDDSDLAGEPPVDPPADPPAAEQPAEEKAEAGFGEGGEPRKFTAGDEEWEGKPPPPAAPKKAKTPVEARKDRKTRERALAAASAAAASGAVH